MERKALRLPRKMLTKGMDEGDCDGNNGAVGRSDTAAESGDVDDRFARLKEQIHEPVYISIDKEASIDNEADEELIRMILRGQNREE